MHGLDSSSGRSVTKLDEITSMSNNISNTKINTMDNFSEIYAKPFNLTIPENTYVPDQVTGTGPAGGHGWFTFLKPLPPVMSSALVWSFTTNYKSNLIGLLGRDDIRIRGTY